MEKINLVFDDEYDDVDILLVPKAIADNIDAVVNEFFSWTAIPENGQRFVAEAFGKTVLGIDTKEFIWWLNEIKISGDEKAQVLEEHTSYCPEYPRADF